MIQKITLLIILYSPFYAITFEEAQKIEKEKGVFEALSFYKSLAKNNNPEAMLRLAKIYSSGKVIKRNITKAHDLLVKANNLNHNPSSYFLGKLYLSKKSPYYNLTKAYNSFVKSGNNGYAPAQNMIGEFLVQGIVVKKDYKMAVNYFEKASKQDYITAQCNLSFMYASGKGVFPNFGRAHAFAKKGVELRNKRCLKVWKDYNLQKYPEDKGWKFNFYTKP